MAKTRRFISLGLQLLNNFDVLSYVQFLAGVGGFVGERLQQDLIWNRVGNLKGRKGGNVGLDLINEFQNKDFKGK